MTLNEKHKVLFYGYGIRLGTQEIARYDWNDDALGKVAKILKMLSEPDLDTDKVKKNKNLLPKRKFIIHL